MRMVERGGPRQPGISLYVALALVVVTWAAIYLPALGTFELKGEEARRILPALEMMEGSSWFVPSILGEEYFRKPPAINWMIAGAVAATGTASEWSARLPSAYAVLAFASVLVLLPGAWLSLPARLTGAILFLVSFGMIEYGRRAEIDAVYAGVCGIAMLVWMENFGIGAKGWRLWLVPSLVMALGLLLKGPLILLFYYVVVASILARAGRTRELLAASHLASLALIAALFGLWAVPAWREAATPDKAAHWAIDMGERLSWARYDLPTQFAQIAKGAFAFSPGLLLVPLLWRRSWRHQIAREHHHLFAGARAALWIGFGLTSLIVVRSRYFFPLIPLASILCGWALAETPSWSRARQAWSWGFVSLWTLAAGAAIFALMIWPSSPLQIGVAGSVVGVTVYLWMGRERWVRGARPAMLGAWSFALLMPSFLIFAGPRVVESAKYQDTARRIAAAVPEGERILVYPTPPLPVVYYLERERPVTGFRGRSAGAGRYLVVEGDDVEDALANPEVAALGPEAVTDIVPASGLRFRIFLLREAVHRRIATHDERSISIASSHTR